MYSYSHLEEKFDELKSQFLEMGQLKSEFDIEKFTVKREGNFIAHNFHFLMRQYSLTLYEYKRLLLDREELTRQIDELKELYKSGERKIGDKYIDIEIKRKQNEIDMIDLNIINRERMIEYFEKCRLKLIELNGGEPPTNEQYQAEEPEYWRWFLLRKALWQFKQAATGISEGIWENIDYLEEMPLINPAYRVEIGSRFDIEKLEKEINEHKRLKARTHSTVAKLKDN